MLREGMQEIPNGVIVIDLKTQDIIIANNEMEQILGKGKDPNLPLKQKILSYILMREIQDGDSQQDRTLRRADFRKGRNLWEHLTNLSEHDHRLQFLFKTKNPKRFV
jgi:hypothetical protein